MAKSGFEWNPDTLVSLSSNRVDTLKLSPLLLVLLYSKVPGCSLQLWRTDLFHRSTLVNSIPIVPAFL